MVALHVVTLSVRVQIPLVTPKQFICPVTLIGSADSLKRSWLSVRIRHGVPNFALLRRKVIRLLYTESDVGSSPTQGTKF